ncbi:MAG: hypothetical protein A2W90_07425 [Bacteroidetes bacterium GWF2_42_66]|nr:MAG: hypothetical protein A2W92_07415 [Bacteroidetes bacterium GWA2_42_15]OFX96919.1 MAG: hypothetical protein A2W89_20125 [Bacteroidetes bacterium GWE2_42_39]OFY44676.1 MAG: hypothetical protein A2W90_07425 [Bacteroidetes bacterium GWF2_42_66]HBL75036.1 hypothetical protein [Prolixibacteraceae bacterium]HCR91574.1 hypothetical protein [Prolixibacteraceae bacterium]
MTVEIASYIKELLLLNDCVVIPDFGGFVSNYKPAQIKHNRFMPPSKEIAFNPKLQKNDGLLINYISEKEGLEYFEAKLKVETFVDESLLKLENYERLTFEDVGQLYYDRMENLLFEPVANQNLLVDSFGLESFSYEKLYEKMMPKPAMKIQQPEAVQVIFSNRNVKKVLIGVPLLLALALIPVKNKDIINHSDLNIFSQLTEMVAPAQEIVAEQTTVKEPEVAPVINNDKYFLIGGSFRQEENAVIFIEMMKKEGYQPEDLGVFNGLHRISIQSFSSFQEAKDKLNELRGGDPKSGVWIHIKQ